MKRFRANICAIMLLMNIPLIAKAQDEERWVQVLHWDRETRQIWLAYVDVYQNRNIDNGLYRTTVDSTPYESILKDGISFLDGDTNTDSGKGIIDISLEVNKIFQSLGVPGVQIPSGEIMVEERDPGTKLGGCSGKWEWLNAQPKCIAGVQPKPNYLSDAWRTWEGHDRVQLLLNMRRWAPALAAQSCTSSSDDQVRHHCPDYPDIELTDAIVDVARNVTPPLEIPPRASEQVLHGYTIMQTSKTESDVWKAINEYNGAIYDAPWLASAYFYRANAEEFLGLYRWAITDYKRFLKLTQSTEDAERARRRIEDLSRLAGY